MYGSYLLILILSLVGLYLLDRTHKLAFTVDPKRAFWSMVPAFVVFVIWDIAGIALGIFQMFECEAIQVSFHAFCSRAGLVKGGHYAVKPPQR
jgi:hypothetical protein